MRRLIGGIIAIAAVGAFAGCGGGGQTTVAERSPTSVGGEGGPPAKVFLPSFAFERRYVEPPRYELEPDGSLVGVDLSWRGWGSGTAIGEGSVIERDWSSAEPGRPRSHPGTVLARGLEACRGEALYSELVVGSPGDPGATPATPIRLPTPCHHEREIEGSASDRTDGPLFFAMPSRNIACSLSPGHVRCDIARKRWSPPPRPDGCRLDWGSTISLPAEGGPSILCIGDTLFGPGYTTLPYREIIARAGLACLSRRDGLICVNEEQKGFFLSLQSFTPF